MKFFCLLILFSLNSYAAITVSENGNQNISDLTLEVGETKLVNIEITSDSSDEIVKISKHTDLMPHPSSEDCLKALNNETCTLTFSLSESGSKFINIFSRSNGVVSRQSLLLRVSPVAQSGEYSEVEIATALTTLSGSFLDLGSFSPGEHFQKIIFLNQGDKIIVSGQNNLMNGDKVRY